MLLTHTRYNARGEAFESVDPLGFVQRTEFDDAGRTVRTIQNYAPGSSAPDANLTVEIGYNADGRQATLTAVNPATGNQTTRYEYGVSPATGSKLTSSDLLRETIYPDAGLDTVRYRYNRRGERIGMTDQNGTVHAYAYDKLGRMTADAVTGLGTGIDGGVREIATTYEVRGLVEKITSRDEAGAVVNEVKNEYNGLGQLTKQFQSHAGAVTGGTPFVEYTYDHTASGGVFTKGARPTSTIYPTTSQERALDYGVAGGAGDKLSRVESISDGDEKSCRYGYLGLGTFVTVEYCTGSDAVASLSYDPLGDRSYAGWDQYTRIIDHHWLKPGTEPETLDWFQYGYDANSNRLYKANLTAQALDKPFDELYRYDQMNRLIDFERGRLNGSNTAIIGTPTKEQTWNLDATGNWSHFTSASDGALETDQTRLHNPVNEITQMSSWFPPAYDHAGNMVKMPKPAEPSEGFVCTYDAWNRLVRVAEADECGCAGQIVSEYQYDGQTWRTTALDYEDGSPDETRHFYYSSEWQILEERVGSLLTPERTHLWGLRYIDEIVHRWRDADEDGTIDESLWALQDANWNVTTVVRWESSVVSDDFARYLYSAYGEVAIYSGDWSAATSNLSLCSQILYTGARRDAVTHLFSLRLRDYHAVLGRFASRDDHHYRSIDTSLYNYTSNAPASLVDPFGRKAEGKVKLTLGLLIGGSNWRGTARFSWVPPDKWIENKNQCSCSRVEPYQIAQTTEIGYGFVSSNPWHFDPIRDKASVAEWRPGAGFPTEPEIGFISHGGRAKVSDDPGYPSWPTFTFELNQQFETCVICTDISSDRYREVFGCIKWRQSYEFEAKRGDVTATYVISSPYKPPITSVVHGLKKDKPPPFSFDDAVGPPALGSAPSTNFTMIVGGRIGGQIAW